MMKNAEQNSANVVDFWMKLCNNCFKVELFIMQFPSAKEIEGLWLRVELQLATSFSRSRFSTSTIKTQNEQMSMLHTEINTYKWKYAFCLSIEKTRKRVIWRRFLNDPNHRIEKALV